jgi:hypothetical protein
MTGWAPGANIQAVSEDWQPPQPRAAAPHNPDAPPALCRRDAGATIEGASSTRKNRSRGRLRHIKTDETLTLSWNVWGYGYLALLGMTTNKNLGLVTSVGTFDASGDGFLRCYASSG